MASEPITLNGLLGEHFAQQIRLAKRDESGVAHARHVTQQGVIPSQNDSVTHLTHILPREHYRIDDLDQNRTWTTNFTTGSSTTGNVDTLLYAVPSNRVHAGACTRGQFSQSSCCSGSATLPPIDAYVSSDTRKTAHEPGQIQHSTVRYPCRSPSVRLVALRLYKRPTLIIVLPKHPLLCHCSPI